MLRGWKGGGDRVPFCLLPLFSLASDKIPPFSLSFPSLLSLLSIIFWHGGVVVRALPHRSRVDDGWIDGWGGN